MKVQQYVRSKQTLLLDCGQRRLIKETTINGVTVACLEDTVDTI